MGAFTSGYLTDSSFLTGRLWWKGRIESRQLERPLRKLVRLKAANLLPALIRTYQHGDVSYRSWHNAAVVAIKGAGRGEPARQPLTAGAGRAGDLTLSYYRYIVTVLRGSLRW